MKKLMEISMRRIFMIWLLAGMVVICSSPAECGNNTFNIEQKTSLVRRKGFIVGLGVARVSDAHYFRGWFDFELDKAVRTAPSFGAVFEYGLSRGFLVCPRVVYSPQGGKMRAYGKESGYLGEIRFNIDYLTFQIPGRVMLSRKSYFEVGPSLRVKIREDIKLLDSQGEDIDVSVNSTDFAVTIGFGYVLPYHDKAITLGSQFSLGLNNIVKSLGPGILYPVHVYNADISFFVGYSW